MSFILDALRKSENERQRNQTPGMATMQAQNMRKGSGIWVPLVALLVGINISLVVVMWFIGDEKQPVTTQAETSNNPAVNTDPPVTRKLSEELGQETTAAIEIPQGKTATLPVAPASVYPEGEEENLPTLAELMLLNAISVPPLHLDIHVYSDTPSERFVFINMSRYNEGATLSEGPKVIHINQSGVVLRHQGQEFQMLREQ